MVIPLIGCAGPVTPHASPPDVAREIPHESYLVVPAELGDPAVDQRIHHRVRLGRYGKVWLRADDAESRSDNEPTPLPEGAVMRVIGETHRRVRVVVDWDREARFAVWIDRADALPAIVADVEVAPNVWLERGAPIAVSGHRVALVDPEIAIAGAADERAIGTVWLARESAIERTEEILPPIGVAVPTGTPIRTAPNGPIIATATADVGATSYVPKDGWTEIEIRRPYAHLQGFVQAPLHDVHGGRIGGLTGTSGFGISDTDRVELPAGACLFDLPDAETIGVNLRSHIRYAHRPAPAHPGWWIVYVGSPWSILAVFAHDLSSDPDAPRWDLCTAKAR